MKKILITGAGGFVGSRILQQWQGKYELCALPKGFFCSSHPCTGGSSASGCDPAHRRSFRYQLLCAASGRSLPCQCGAASLAGTGCAADEGKAGGIQLGSGLCRCAAAGAAAGNTGPASQYKLEAEQRVLELCPDSAHLRASWMYDLPGYGLPIRGNLPLNLLRAALKGEALRFSRNDHRGVTYVRQVIENLEPAMALPGGVYNFGSGNAENMVCTARQFAETLGIAVQIEEESWGRNLVMDTTKLERFGIRFDTTQQGIQRCLKDYGLRTL